MIVFVCWVLGPSCPLLFSFPPQPSLCSGFRRGRVRVDRGGGLEEGSLAGEVGGKGFFVFLLIRYWFCFSVCFCFVVVFVGFVFVLFFVLLEWSRCCSCFEPIPLERQHQQKRGILTATGEAVAIYIYMPESYFWYHFFGLSRVRNSTTLKKKSFLQQPEANQELETDPPDS